MKTKEKKVSDELEVVSEEELEKVSGGSFWDVLKKIGEAIKGTASGTVNNNKRPS